MGGRGSCRSYGLASGAACSCSAVAAQKLRVSMAPIYPEIKLNSNRSGSFGAVGASPPVRRTAYARARLLPILWGLHHVRNAHAPLLLRKSCV